ncbi:MAG TPA: hypothetical protein VGD37_10705 [Kofleriaceae bacterium]|jgi:hypothetical protein
MHAFEAIDVLELVTVTGGEDSGTFSTGAGPNRTRASGNLQVKTPVGLDVSGTGTYESARSNYGACLDKLPSNPTTQQLDTCARLAGGQ